MPCGCAGSAQRGSQRKAVSDARGARMAPVADTRAIGDAGYFWNGPKRSSTQNKQHTRRQG